MPSLILFRHGKSDWNAGEADDLVRPLSGRGRRSARTMGRFLADAGQLPDHVLSSPAERALETIRIAMEAGRWSCPVGIRNALYGGVAELLDELRGLPPEARVALIVGHEPTWSETLELLIGGGRVRMPTGALARVELDVARWEDLGPARGELTWLVHPKLLGTEARDTP